MVKCYSSSKQHATENFQPPSLKECDFWEVEKTRQQPIPNELDWPSEE